MINVAFRLLLAFNATSLLLVVYLVQNGLTLDRIPALPAMAALPSVISYLFYMGAPLALTKLSIALSSSLGKDEFKKGSVKSIEHANNSFLPSYLGYFFVALSVSNVEALLFVYFVIFAFTFLSQALYFNPLFLVFGYDFYNLKTSSGTAIFLISKARYKVPSEVAISAAYRINNHTFMERG